MYQGDSLSKWEMFPEDLYRLSSNDPFDQFISADLLAIANISFMWDVIYVMQDTLIDSELKSSCGFCCFRIYSLS